MGRFALSLFAVVGTIAVTSANTIPTTPIAELEYIAHEINKYWPVSQCPYVLNGGIRSYTAPLEKCKSDCNGHPECTAIHHHEKEDRCELKHCRIPAPDPTETSDGWTGYSLKSGWKTYFVQFNGLRTSPVTSKKRQELLKNMVDAERKVLAQVADPWIYANEIWTAEVDYIHLAGEPQIIGMSAIQKTPTPLVPHVWQRPYIQFDSVASIPKIPNKIFFTLLHNSNQLGNVIITLDGDIFYPRLGRQMLELATGNNKDEGTWRGAGFTNLTEPLGPIGPPQYIGVHKYIGPEDHMHSASLFPVEVKGEPVPLEIGQVRSMGDQSARWRIVTRTGILSDSDSLTDPVIGHVTTGMDIIQSAITNGKRYALDVKFSNAGLVIYEP